MQIQISYIREGKVEDNKFLLKANMKVMSVSILETAVTNSLYDTKDLSVMGESPTYKCQHCIPFTMPVVKIKGHDSLHF